MARRNGIKVSTAMAQRVTYQAYNDYREWKRGTIPAWGALDKNDRKQRIYATKRAMQRVMDDLGAKLEIRVEPRRPSDD